MATHASLSDTSQALRALADPTRLRILHLLSHHELTVAELTRILASSQSTISQHLAQLRDAELVADRRDGTRSFHSRTPSSGPAAQAWAELESVVAASAESKADLAALEPVLAARAEESRAYFDRIAEAIEHEYLPGRTWEGLAKAVLRLMPRCRVADLGIGGGELTLLLCTASEKVIGVDASKAMLERVKAKAQRAGVDNLELRHGEIESLPLADEEVDVVLLSQTLHHAELPARALAEAFRVLTPGGRLLVLDLVKHKEHEAQRRFADRWPGFHAREVAQWLADVGFMGVETSVVARERNAPHFQTLLAVAEKPATKKNGTRPRAARSRRNSGNARNLAR